MKIIDTALQRHLLELRDLWGAHLRYRCRRIGLPPCCLLFARALIADPEAFQRDRVKQNELALMGYQVLRFTWLDLTEYPERVIAESEFALSRRAGDAANSRTGAAH